MNSSHGSEYRSLFKQKPSSSIFTYDVKPLVKIALDPRTSTDFCEKTNTLAQLNSSRCKTIKMQFNEVLADSDIESFIEELYDKKSYLNPFIHKKLGKYLTSTHDIKQETRRKVGLLAVAIIDKYSGQYRQIPRILRSSRHYLQ